ncbi:MAG TPA: HAD family phosphatase [Gammaproteobacteria bacterium]
MISHVDIRAAVFDVDGVIVRSRFRTELARVLGMTAEETQPFFTGPFVECLLGKADLRDKLPQYLEAWKWSGTVDEFLKFWFESDSDLDSPCLKFIEKLRANGFRCYLASTQEQHRAAYLESQMGLGNRFDGSFFSCRVGLRKPDPAYFRLVQSRIGVEPEQILFLDDREANVVAAEGVGWHAMQFRRGDALDGIAAQFDLLSHGA